MGQGLWIQVTVLHFSFAKVASVFEYFDIITSNMKDSDNDARHKGEVGKI